MENVNCKICKIGELNWKVNDVIINNSMINNELPHPLPWGVNFAFVKLTNNIINDFRKSKSLNSELLLTVYNNSTDKNRRKGYKVNRKIISGILAKNGFHNQKKMSHDLFYSIIGKYKFVVSPEGYHIDCHRHYETWLSGGIPIIEENEFIKKKYEGLPILWTKNYSEITKDYLNIKYKEFEEKIFDYRKLFLSYYNYEQKIKIKTRGNYWINKWVGIIDYYKI